jgi:hypothetical protein
MWVAGCDNNSEGETFAYENNMIQGLRAADPVHLWSGHFDMNLGVIWSSDHPVFGSSMDIDGLYVWTESVLFERGPQYKTELEQYKKGRMIMQLDLSYEHDNPHYADNENPQWIRRKIYDGLLSGCAGTSFSSGVMGNYSLSFKNWKPLMSTTGMWQVSYCFRLFESVSWYKLIPDQGSDIICRVGERLVPAIMVARPWQVTVLIISCRSPGVRRSLSMPGKFQVNPCACTGIIRARARVYASV